MTNRTRRELLSDVGRGMISASVGVTLTRNLGFDDATAAEDSDRLTFGELDPLVNFLQDTPPDKLISKIVEKLRNGTELKQLIAAAALTNARAFGGVDYVGYHALMALVPAYQMAEAETDPARKPLAVLKVLHRNSARLTDFGNTKETLKVVRPDKNSSTPGGGEQLRAACRKTDVKEAETIFARIAGREKPEDALNQLIYAVEDATEVHRVVLVSRAWDLLRFVGMEQTHTMLRQSLRYCIEIEKKPQLVKHNAEVRELLPKLIDQHKLLSTNAGTRSVNASDIEKVSESILSSSPAKGAAVVAELLAENVSVDAVGEALSLAANQLLLRDEGRPKAWASPGKPEGSVHGDSIGLHCCDTIHAWRSLARVGDRRTQVTSLILAAYQVARDRTQRTEFATWEPYPREEHRKLVKGLSAEMLLKELDGAIREKDQGRAAALTDRIGKEQPDRAKDVLALFCGFAISEDGALHAEKYYATAADEFATTRPEFRWRHLVALARVSASQYGFAAPAYKEACTVLKLK